MQTATPPKAPTPLNPPRVYYNLKWIVPPIIVDTQEDADALDPTEWTTNPPQPAGPQADWPQLYYNINVSPKIVDDAKEAAALGGEWKQFDLPQALVTAAQKQLDAAKSAKPAA